MVPCREVKHENFVIKEVDSGQRFECLTLPPDERQTLEIFVIFLVVIWPHELVSNFRVTGDPTFS